MLDFVIDREKCSKCGECVKDCPVGIIAMDEDLPYIDAEKADRCLQCQHCLAVCPTGAVSIFGKNPEDSIPLLGNLPNAAQVETLLKGRRSVRRFLPEPVDAATIDRLLAIAAHAPTGVNNRGVLFSVVEDQATMDKLRHETMEGVRTAVAQESLPKRLQFFGGILKAWDKGVDVIFRKAPHLLVVSAPVDAPCPEADSYIALSYFELMAQAMGLGTLWLGLARWAMVDIAPQVSDKLGLPDSHKLVYMMLFGKPAVTYHRTVQRDEDLKVNRVVW
jgi:nitroreductase/NAD-dependent dihydropyrimidine dehydrogenase PreA subunit